MKETVEKFLEQVRLGIFKEEMAAELRQHKGETWVKEQKKLAHKLTKLKKELHRKYGELPEVVTTVGVYPNGPSVVNAVAKRDILYHVYYNLRFRPGRGLLINNEIFYSGGVGEQKLLSELALHGAREFDTPSTPYN